MKTQVGDYVRICHNGISGMKGSAWLGNGVGRVKRVHRGKDARIAIGRITGGLIWVRSWIVLRPQTRQPIMVILPTRS